MMEIANSNNSSAPREIQPRTIVALKVNSKFSLLDLDGSQKGSQSSLQSSCNEDGRLAPNELVVTFIYRG